MSFLNPPSRPNPTQEANAQAAYNQQAARQQQSINMVGQNNPFGSLNWTSDPNSPSGYTANVSLAPAQQAILDELNAAKIKLGGAAGSEAGTAATLANQFPGLYGQPFDLQGPTGATAQMLNQWQQKYLSPIFGQQQSNLDAQLQNQGLVPGSTAYNNAQNLLARNQGDVTTNYLTKNQGQAFEQALTQYGLPLATLQQLMQGAAGAPSPIAPNSLFATTPQEQIGAPNYIQADQNANAVAQQQYQNMIKGIGQIAGVAAAPFTGGASLALSGMTSMPGMFGGGAGAGSAGGWGNMFSSSPTVLGGSF